MEEVTEEEGKELSEKIGAVFGITSALRGIGIEELFKNIGYKLLGLNYDVDKKENNNGNGTLSKSASYKLKENIDTQGKKDKKHCCINK